MSKTNQARGKWAKGFKPYRDALRKLKLPPAGPMGSPENYARILAVVDCMRAVKVREDAKKAAAKQGRKIDRR